MIRCILWQCLLEKGGRTSCYFEHSGQWDLNFLILKFNLHHKSKIWMFLRVCKDWLFSSTADFVSESAVPLPWSICAPYHPVRLLGYKVLLDISIFSAFFFLTGMPLCDISFPVLISSSPAYSPWLLAVPIAPPVFFQKLVFSCQVLFFLPHLLLTLLPHHSHILSFLPVHSLSCIFLCSHPVLPNYQTYSVSFILLCF